jgi:hypothetical protein
MSRRLWCALFSAVALAILAGCEEPKADELAVRKVRSVVVVPLRSEVKDAVAGQIAAGLVAARLKEQQPKNLQVLACPVLCRLRDEPGEFTDEQALDLARRMGVDGVVTGVLGEEMKLPGKPKSPVAMRAAQAALEMGGSGDTWVQIRLLSVAEGKCVYEMKGQESGDKPAERLRKGTDQALNPLIQMWNKDKP